MEARREKGLSATPQAKSATLIFIRKNLTEQVMTKKDDS
jgi:hypothetical protein